MLILFFVLASIAATGGMPAIASVVFSAFLVCAYLDWVGQGRPRIGAFGWWRG